MKILFIIIFSGIQVLYAQNGKNITLSGTPQTDSARKALVMYDTIFVHAAHLLPDSLIACADLKPYMYPAQQHDDYLHEERFDSLSHVVLFDHIATRKVMNVLIPTLKDERANLCGVNLTLTNPQTGQVVVFYDIFNWVSSNKKFVFNTNREVYNVWKLSGSVMAFPIRMVHSATGDDFTFGHKEMKLDMRGF